MRDFQVCMEVIVNVCCVSAAGGAVAGGFTFSAFTITFPSLSYYGGFLTMNELMRKKCKELKCFAGIPYKEIAEYLEVKRNSFYNWLKGDYNFSPERLERLQEIVANL